MKTCPQCQKENIDESKFCAFCGNALEANNEQTQPATPLIENAFPMTKDTLRQLYKHFKLWGIITCVIGGIFFIWQTILFVLWGDELAFTDFALLIFGIVFLYFYHLFVHKNKIVSADTRVVYQFYEDEFCGLTFRGEEKTEESKLTYKQIQKAKKLGDFYYLYVGAVALIIKMDTFTVGTKEDFIALLKEKCDPKTVKIKK